MKMEYLNFIGKNYLVPTQFKELLFNIETLYPKPYSSGVEDE